CRRGEGPTKTGLRACSDSDCVLPAHEGSFSIRDTPRPARLVRHMRSTDAAAARTRGANASPRRVDRSHGTWLSAPPQAQPPYGGGGNALRKGRLRTVALAAAIGY